MDTNLMRCEDSLAINKKRKRNKGAKLKATKEDAFQMKDQINANQEASAEIKESNVFDMESENNVLDIDVELLHSVGNMDKKKTKKRKGTKKKVNALNEVQSIDQAEMKKVTTGICAGVMDQMDEKLKSLDNISGYDCVTTSGHGSTVNASEGNMDKKKLKRHKKTKKKLMTEVISMDQMELCTETTEQEVNKGLENNLPFKDVTVLPLVGENVSSEVNSDTKTVKRRKKTKNKVNLLKEHQSVDPTTMTSDSTPNLSGIKSHVYDNLGSSDQLGDFSAVNKELEKNILDDDLTLPSLVDHPKLDVLPIEDASVTNMDKKKIKRRKKIKKKADLMNEVESITQMEMNSRATEDLVEVHQKIEDRNIVNKESENSLPGEDVTVLSLPEYPVLENGPTGNAYKNVDKKKKRSKVKRKPNVEDEVQSMELSEQILTSTNLAEVDQVGVNLSVSDNISKSSVAIYGSEQKRVGKDASVLLLAEHPAFDAGLTPDTCEANVETVNVVSEFRTMDEMVMITKTTENLPVANGKRKRKKKSKRAKDKDEVLSMDDANGQDVSSLLLTTHPELDTRSTDNASEANMEDINVKSDVQTIDHVGMITRTTPNFSESKSHIDDNLETSDQFGECIAVSKQSENTILDSELTLPSLVEHSNLNFGTDDASIVGMDKKKIKRRKKIKKSTDVMNESESMARIEMNPAVTEDLAEINDRKIEDYKVVDKESKNSPYGEDLTVISLPEHPKLESVSNGNTSEGSMIVEKKKKWKKKINVENEVQSMEEQGSTFTNLSEVKDEVGVSLNASDDISGITVVSYESEKAKLNVTNAFQSMEQPDQNLTSTKLAEVKDQVGASDNIREFTVVSYGSEKNDLVKNAIVLPLAEHAEFDVKFTPNAPEGNGERVTENLLVANGEKKKNSDMDKIEDGVQSMNKANDEDVSVLPLSKHPELNAFERNMENTNIETVAQAMDQVVMMAEATENIGASSVNGRKERKKRRKKKTGKNIAEAQSMNTASSTNQVTMIDEAAQGNKNLANGLNEVEGETIVYQGRFSAEGNSITPIYNNGGTMHLSPSYAQQGNYVYPLPAMGLFFVPYPRAPVVTYRRKLLILDINGLLADIVMPAPKDRRGDVHMLGRAIFKRPFCDDFLIFCFQNFDVGIWSSRSKKLIDKIVDYLLGNLRNKLFFCWDMTHATQSVFKTLENKNKPLVCKDITKFWGDDKNRYYWKKGDYNASNTLLLDDSPYKALLNPPHTAIFPRSFSYLDGNDNSLGPGGDLRVYLEGLLLSDNVQTYVEQHPFGQSVINEKHPSWEFYSRVLRSMRQRSNTSSYVPHIHFS